MGLVTDIFSSFFDHYLSLLSQNSKAVFLFIITIFFLFVIIITLDLLFFKINSTIQKNYAFFFNHNQTIYRQLIDTTYLINIYIHICIYHMYCKDNLKNLNYSTLNEIYDRNKIINICRNVVCYYVYKFSR